MYTIYLTFLFILVLSFVTGTILSIVEHKLAVDNKKVSNIFFDEEII